MKFGFKLLTLLLVLSSFAQETKAQVIDDFGQWNAFFMQDKVDSNSKLRWWFDGHYRMFDDTDGFGQSIVRPGLGWDIGENSTLWAGYGWIHTSPIVGDDTDEHRLWQQWTWSKKCEPFKFAMRTRFEQRIVESSDDTGLRLRQFFRFQKDLNDRSLFVVWDEIFIGLNDTDFGQRAGFDQNRMFVGFGLKNRTKTWRTEVGYMLQTVNRQGGIDRSNHILAVNLFRTPRK